MSKVASHTWLLAWNESMTRVQNRSKRSRALGSGAGPGSGSPMARAISAPKSSMAVSTAALSSALVEP